MTRSVYDLKRVVGLVGLQRPCVVDVHMMYNLSQIISLGGAVVVAFGCNSLIVTDRSCVRITPWRHMFLPFAGWTFESLSFCPL